MQAMSVTRWADDEQSQVNSEPMGERCGVIPYPNPDIVDHLTCSVDRHVLCTIRDVLFDASSVRTNTESFPDVYDGRVLGDNNRLSPRQLGDLKGLLKGSEAYNTDNLYFDMDTLVACKIVVGRWLRPSEMTAIFGYKAKLVTKRYTLQPADGDSEVSLDGGDYRISYAIGRAGHTLNTITRDAKCLYIWFGTFGGKAVMHVYARTAQALEKARFTINRHQSRFKGRGFDTNKLGFSVVANKAQPKNVTLNALYKMMNR